MYVGSTAGWKRGRLDEFSKWRTMAFVVDIGYPLPLCALCASPSSAFVFRSTTGTDTFSLPCSLLVLCLPSSFPRSRGLLEASRSRRCGKNGNPICGPAKTCLLSLSLSPSLFPFLDSFINRDIRAPSKASRRRDNRAGVATRFGRYVRRPCPDRECMLSTMMGFTERKLCSRLASKVFISLQETRQTNLINCKYKKYLRHRIAFLNQTAQVGERISMVLLQHSHMY